MASSSRNVDLHERIHIALTPTSPPGLVQALTVDPWDSSGSYGLGWTYFVIVLIALLVVARCWHWWQDKIRQAIYKQEVEAHYQNLYRLEPGWDQSAATAGLGTGKPSQQHSFCEEGGKAQMAFRPKSNLSSVGFVNDTLALFRYVFYRPIPDIILRRNRFTFSRLPVLACVFVAAAFVTVYCLLPQPLYWQSIRYGAPPIAVRSGMLAIALTPWIFATSTKANMLTWITGIGPERLNVFHRWLGYLGLFLSLIHMVPFYVTPVWDDGGWDTFQKLFPPGSGIIYGSGIACLVPLCWLCVGSLPVIRRKAYETFALLHAPVGLVYLGMLFWHSKNFLMSWNYLYASLAIFVSCQIARLRKLNWTIPGRKSFLLGDEAAINIMSENCIKITIPTQMRWKPGQYVYLRMPGISLLENHPFTITSLCSEDFPSEYGDQFCDCVLVFRPHGGFTRCVLDTAIAKGPHHVYRALLDGPYGGMRRELAAFDTCILIAGGSGITSLVSQLLNLIKRMRDGKAITKRVVIVWALRRLEAMEWFREELRICRESAPPESVTCRFFVTSAVRNRELVTASTAGVVREPLTLSHRLHDKLDGSAEAIASKRDEALTADEATGGAQKERELRAENANIITALPQKHLQPHSFLPPPPPPQVRIASQEELLRRLGGQDCKSDVKEDTKPPLDAHYSSGPDELPPEKTSELHLPPLQHRVDPPQFNHVLSDRKQQPSQSLEQPTDMMEIRPCGDEDLSHPEPKTPIQPPELAHLRTTNLPPARPPPASTSGHPSGSDFGFPHTPSEFQKSLMRFAFPVSHQDCGWSIEYGRPDLDYMLREWAAGGADGRGILGRRTAVFVCGPGGMRVGVARAVARLQAQIWGDEMLEEVFLHVEDYTL